MTIRRGALEWSTTHTSFNRLTNSPRCTTERSSDGHMRYRLHAFDAIDVPAQQIHFWNLPISSTCSASRRPARLRATKTSRLRSRPAAEMS